MRSHRVVASHHKHFYTRCFALGDCLRNGRTRRVDHGNQSDKS
jgi:hypothetical protein